MGTKLQISYQDALVNTEPGPMEGTATKAFQDFLTALVRSIPSLSPRILTDFGAAGNGQRDDTAAFQKALDQVAADGGGTLLMPPGTYLLGKVTIPAGSDPILLLGYGESTVLKRGLDIPDGSGMLDIFGSNVTFQGFLIDGGVTAPVGLLYNADFTGIGANDPMALSLTRNTSVWVHSASGFTARNLIVQHTGGYAVLLDGGISDARVLDSTFRNNRPHLFGTVAGEAIYGSWTGGLYINGDGRAANPGLVAKGVMVARCRFLRDTGNCCWSHVYGFDELHEDFQFIDNCFLDCGLDGILVGGVTGGTVGGNVMRRIGYTTLTDTDRSYPRWLPGVQATAIDSSGIVKGVPYFNNSMTSINGGCMDLDGHSDSAITGNVMRCPYPGEPEYDEDQIAITGVNNGGSDSYGINLGNTSDTPWGGKNVEISGNQIINLSAGAVRLFAARDCQLNGNNIISPDVPVYPPIAYGPLSASPYRRARNNVIRHNRISYSPPSAAPAIFEDGQYSPFTADDKNYVFGNVVLGNGNATEFQKNPDSGSPVYLPDFWFKAGGMDGGAF